MGLILFLRMIEAQNLYYFNILKFKSVVFNLSLTCCCLLKIIIDPSNATVHKYYLTVIDF